MKYLLFILAIGGILFASCKQSPRKQASSLSFSKELQDDTTGTKPAMSTADSIRPEQIRLHAELVYDSVSYLTIENNGVLPVRTDKTYQLMHYIHNQWKPVKVNQADTSSVTIAAGEKDTLWIHFKRQIGYEPIGRCSISKTFYSLSQPQCSIQKAIEAHTRSIIIDWNRCELIPDRTELTNLYVDMRAIPSEENLLLTIHNHSDQTLICGNETDYTISIFQDNQWKEISYPKITEDLAVVLPPGHIISNWKYRLPYGRFHFKPGRYRIIKDFSLESDYRKKLYTAAEFTLQYEVYAGKEGEVVIK